MSVAALTSLAQELQSLVENRQLELEQIIQSVSNINECQLDNTLFYCDVIMM